MFNSEFLNTIILLGAVQGFIFSCLLWFTKTKPLNNRILSVLILLIALANLKIYCINQSWFSNSIASVIFDAFIPLIIIMPAGPLVFFYTKTLLDPEYTLSKKDSRQFYTIILDLLPNIIAIVYVIGIITHTIKKSDRPIGQFLDEYNNYVDIPRWISLSIYVYISYKIINRIKQFRQNNKDEQQEKRLRWAKQFVLVFTCFQIIWFLHLVPYVIPAFSNRLIDWGNWYPLYIPLSILIYWLGIKGYMMSVKFAHQQKKKNGKATELSDTLIEAISSTLTRAMEEDKLYLNPDLNLAQLSEHTGIAQKIISEVLNQYLHRNFNEFVNEYRINEIINRLLLPESKKLTITGLAYDCGFNSQPTFQRAFKSMKGVSPTEFIAKKLSKSSSELI